MLTNEMWVNECKKAFSKVDLPLITVVEDKNNSHWIEWIKIVHIQSHHHPFEYSDHEDCFSICF